MAVFVLLNFLQTHLKAKKVAAAKEVAPGSLPGVIDSARARPRATETSLPSHESAVV
jgi:hypothetical protein